jgi:hypothetical protein
MVGGTTAAAGDDGRRGEEKLAHTTKELAARESSGDVAARNDYGGVAAQESCGNVRNGYDGTRDGCSGARDNEEAWLRGCETTRRHGCVGTRWRGGAAVAVEKARRR